MGQRPEGPEARAGFGVGDVAWGLDGVLRGFGAADSVNSENSAFSGGVGEYNGAWGVQGASGVPHAPLVDFAPPRACALDEADAEAQLVLGQLLQFMRVFFSSVDKLRLNSAEIDEILSYTAKL